MEFATIRMVGYVAVICGCFIFMYPKLIHPVVKSIFGISTSDVKKNDGLPDSLPGRPPMPPGGHARGHPDAPSPENMRQHMRPGPHPGMRAAAEMNSRQTKASSGRGMIGIILPMYAVGIVVYLVYTLFKVFNKKDAKSASHEREREQHSPEPRPYTDHEGRVSRQPKASPTEQMGPQDIQKQLESLVNKAQEKDMSEDDMQQLQARLADTEAQMTRILQAMQSVQSRVQQTTQEVKQSEQKENQSELPQASPNDTKQGNGESSAESTPDSDSYEILNRSDKESSGDDSLPLEPETITAKSTEEVTMERLAKGGKPGQSGDGADDEEEETVDVVLEEKKEAEEEDSSVRRRVTKTDETKMS